MLHVRIIQFATALPHGIDQALGLVGNYLGALLGHQSGDTQFNHRQFLSVCIERHTTSDLTKAIGSQRHILMVGTHHYHMVRIVGYSGRHGARSVVTEA